MNNFNIIGIAGSLRKESFNHSLLETASEILRKENASLEIMEIGNLPYFSQDLEAEEFPAEAQELKNKIEQADGIIIATPEYNRSMPGVLKNAIDWTSRPYGQNAWVRKPVLVMGASIAGTATAIAQSHLKHTMLYLDALVLGQPEFYLGNASEKFDDNGKLKDENTLEFLKNTLQIFQTFVSQNKV